MILSGVDVELIRIYIFLVIFEGRLLQLQFLVLEFELLFLEDALINRNAVEGKLENEKQKVYVKYSVGSKWVITVVLIQPEPFHNWNHALQGDHKYNPKLLNVL